MHDDASTTYTSMIDQTTLGHQFIADVFGEEYLPRVGWTIDPFGLSSVTPKINHEFKEDYHVIVRVSYERKKQLIDDRSLEFLWRYDPVHNDSKHEIFTHVTYEHYGSIEHFNWDYGDAPVTDANIAALSEQFVNTVRKYATSYLTNHILFPLGNDFEYQNATINFSNMTKV
jgi:alpha-mannosidase